MDSDGYVDIVSCPTCGRTTGNHEAVVRDIKAALQSCRPNRKVKIAIMGCVVNGPGEAKEADIGIAFAKNGAVVFRHGEVAYSGEREETLKRFKQDCIKECQ